LKNVPKVKQQAKKRKNKSVQPGNNDEQIVLHRNETAKHMIDNSCDSISCQKEKGYITANLVGALQLPCPPWLWQSSWSRAWDNCLDIK
jgi:hypothetical protein